MLSGILKLAPRINGYTSLLGDMIFPFIFQNMSGCRKASLMHGSKTRMMLDGLKVPMRKSLPLATYYVKETPVTTILKPIVASLAILPANGHYQKPNIKSCTSANLSNWKRHLRQKMAKSSTKPLPVNQSYSNRNLLSLKQRLPVIHLSTYLWRSELAEVTHQRI